MVPPSKMGKVTWIAEKGNYTILEAVLELEFQSKTSSYTMLQIWPVRTPRPVSQLLTSEIPLTCGIRVLDTLFPCAQGGTAAIPGAYGSGKTMIIHCVSKYSNSDNIVLVGCGERGTDVSETIMEFPEVTVTAANGTQESLMKKY